MSTLSTTFPWTLPPTAYTGVQVIGEALRARARGEPDRPLFTLAGDAPLTAGELERRALAFAADLLDTGCTQHDRVAVVLPNGGAFLAAQYGLALAGLIEVPIHSQYRGRWLQHVLDVTAPRGLVVHADLLDRFEYLVREGRWPESVAHVWLVGDAEPPPWLPVDCVRFEPALGHRAAPPLPEVAEEDPACILFTSGTTGRSKGAVLSHRAALSLANEVVETMGYTPSDVLFSAFPLFHASAKFVACLASLVSGARTVLLPRYSASEFLDIARREGVTAFNYVGAMLTTLHKQPPRPDDADNPIQRAWGAPTPIEFAADFERRFGIDLIEVYGSTELGAVTHCTRSDRVLGSCGRPVRHYEVELHDERGLPVPTGVAGEIVVRPRVPSMLFDRYWGMPDETVAAWRNLWFHTGDLARRDEDGRFWYVDRLRDTVRRKGENISSAELEHAIQAHPAVRLAAVYGVKSELSEDEVVVAILLAEGCELDPTELIAFCEPRVPAFAVPRFVRIVEELPMTPSGRVEKYRLREEGVPEGTWDRLAAQREVAGERR